MMRRLPVLSLVLLATACGGGGDDGGGDGGGGTGDPLIDLVDGVMAPAIDGDARDAQDTCVSAMVAVVTADRAEVLGYGATVAGGATRPDGATLYQIGSISKLFTGLGLARRVAAGQLGADDPVVGHLAAELQPPLVGVPITLAHLISHRAGFPAMPTNLVDRDLDGQRDATIDPLSPGAGYSSADLRRYLDGFQPGAAPGSAYAYSNLGLGLAGLALEEHLGVSGYHAVLRQLVTDDLAMTDTWGQVALLDDAARARVVQGYAPGGSGRGAGHLAEMGVLAAAGEIVTTGDDMQLLLAALSGQTATPLDAAIGLAVTPLAPRASGGEIGYAVEVDEDATGTLYSKGGNTPSFTAYLRFRRAPQQGVIVMTSCGEFMRARELATAIDSGLLALPR